MASMCIQQARAGAALGLLLAVALLSVACNVETAPLLPRPTATMLPPTQPPSPTATVLALTPTTQPSPTAVPTEPPTAVPRATPRLLPTPWIEVGGTVLHLSPSGEIVEIQPQPGFTALDLGEKQLAGEVPGGWPTATASRPLLFSQSGELLTETCPLNGSLHTKAEQQAWAKHRPLGVMIENHPDARPQFGLSVADVVYEAVAEGGITRFLAIFYCDSAAKSVRIGPIRSARTYFLDWISEYGLNPLYAHVGGAACDPRTGSGCLNGAKADALGQIRAYGWAGYNDLDEFSVGRPTFWRDYSRGVATEHTMYSDTQQLWALAQKRGLTHVDSGGRAWQTTFTPWKFADNHVQKVSSARMSVGVDFWQRFPRFAVTWVYNPGENTYSRMMGGAPHIDAATGKQIKVSTIIIQFQQESRANDGYFQNLHLLYGTIGAGKAKIIQNGQVIDGTWRKPNREARTLFYDERGDEIRLTPGKIWIQTVPLDSEVTIK